MKRIRRVLGRKDEGNAGIVICGMFTLIIVALFGVFVMFQMVIATEAESVQDDVTLSSLAVYKDVDINKFIDNNELEITDVNSAVQTFKYYLSKNMKLDLNLSPIGGSVASSQVTINEFTIYNVRGNTAEILTYNNGNFTESKVENMILNPVKTSNGSIVKNTTVHATISYNVRLLFGQESKVTTSVDTDIVK
ncbi:hypothetical protein KYB31_10270 [Clostridium felsineum]|uniref:hypothetical protein n=1 Tax=Clostridium felsineum TaxID=36839 RepID=UPI00214D430B|nr:hypothetical protein [Clostridium felsineum]MCR3759371.1 hypothetical protein [Clostridium felsineum]